MAQTNANDIEPFLSEEMGNSVSANWEIWFLFYI